MFSLKAGRSYLKAFIILRTYHIKPFPLDLNNYDGQILNYMGLSRFRHIKWSMGTVKLKYD